jgi:hypothetical protein
MNGSHVSRLTPGRQGVIPQKKQQRPTGWFRLPPGGQGSSPELVRATHSSTFHPVDRSFIGRVRSCHAGRVPPSARQTGSDGLRRRSTFHPVDRVFHPLANPDCSGLVPPSTRWTGAFIGASLWCQQSRVPPFTRWTGGFHLGTGAGCCRSGSIRRPRRWRCSTFHPVDRVFHLPSATLAGSTFHPVDRVFYP